MKPKIIFKINKSKDVRNFHLFLIDAEYNRSILNWAFFKKYPELKSHINENGVSFSVDDEFVKKFVDDYYSCNRILIKKDMANYQKLWSFKKEEYFELVGLLFDPIYWPKGDYTVYATMWGMFPRFLEERSFHVPVIYKKKSYIPVVIAHEMLHFIFYNYISINPLKFRKEEDSFFVWHLSEIFNSIVQNSEPWFELFQVKAQIYPEHRKIIDVLNRKKKNTAKINSRMLIQEIIKELRKNPGSWSHID